MFDKCEMLEDADVWARGSKFPLVRSESSGDVRRVDTSVALRPLQEWPSHKALVLQGGI